MTTTERLRAATVATAAHNGNESAELGEYGCLVGGQWIKTGDAIDVRNPYDGSLVAIVHRAGPEQIEQAIAAATTAFQTTRKMPSWKRADQLSIGEITLQRSDLVARANDNQLHPADIAGGNFTITNLGMYNVDVFNAIINSPQAAILAIGRIADRVVAENGKAAVRPTLFLSLSSDHRVVDGARAAKFLDDLVNLIEEPWGILA